MGVGLGFGVHGFGFRALGWGGAKPDRGKHIYMV